MKKSYFTGFLGVFFILFMGSCSPQFTTETPLAGAFQLDVSFDIPESFIRSLHSDSQVHEVRVQAFYSSNKSPVGSFTSLTRGASAWYGTLNTISQAGTYAFTAQALDVSGKLLYSALEPQKIISGPQQLTLFVDSASQMEVSQVQITGGNKVLNLTWVDPISPQATTIQVNLGSQSWNVARGVRSFQITGLSDDNSYSVTLKGKGDFNQSTAGLAVVGKTSPSSTVYVPFIGPYLGLIQPQTTGTWNNPTVLDPATHVVIQYESRDENFVPKAWYRVLGQTFWTEVGEDASQSPSFPSNYGKVHHFTLSGLSPSTLYQYRVLGPQGNLSSTYTFKTAGTNDNFSRFLVIGDQQDEQGKQRWQNVSAAIVADHLDEFDFIITVGDMVKDDMPQNGDRFHWWWVFFDKGRELFARKVMLPAMGNHDTPGNSAVGVGADGQGGPEDYWSNAQDSLSFRKYFYMVPDMSKPDYYSFSWGNAWFMSVNSEIPVFFGRYPGRDNQNQRSSQDNWLKDQISGKAQTRTWSLAYFHVPPFNPAGGKAEVAYARPWSKEFNNKIDWSITGHVHTYQRVRPLWANDTTHSFKPSYGRTTEQGVGYLIAPPSGQFPRTSTATAMTTELASYPQFKGVNTYEIGFSLVNIQGSTFSMKTYGMGDTDGRNPSGYGDNGGKRLLDSLTYTKAGVDYSRGFTECFYRGTTNNWGQTAMTLVGDNLWETTVVVTPGEASPGFKFYTNFSGVKWYGDNNGDGKAQSDETNNINFSQGTGSYRLRFNDLNRDFTVTKL